MLSRRYFVMTFAFTLGIVFFLRRLGFVSAFFAGIMLLLFGIAFELLQLKRGGFEPFTAGRFIQLLLIVCVNDGFVFSAGDSHVINIFGRCGDRVSILIKTLSQVSP